MQVCARPCILHGYTLRITWEKPETGQVRRIRQEGVEEAGGGGTVDTQREKPGGKEEALLQPGPDSQRAEELGVLKIHKDPTNPLMVRNFTAVGVRPRQRRNNRDMATKAMRVVGWGGCAQDHLPMDFKLSQTMLRRLCVKREVGTTPDLQIT